MASQSVSLQKSALAHEAFYVVKQCCLAFGDSHGVFIRCLQVLKN
jgi:hypothetical protein